MNTHKYKQLSLEQRSQLQLLLKMGKSKKEIAEELGVHRSTVYRELKRNAKKAGGYSARYAEQLYQERKERFRRKRRWTEAMRKFVDEKLGQQQWSSEQIVGYCRTNGIPMVSHETIYQYVYHDKKQGGTLYKKLRIAGTPYRKRYGKKDRRGKIPDPVSIQKRPSIVNEKGRYGDWEVDTLIGKGHKHAILTIVERKSYFTLLAKMEFNRADIVRKTIINALAPFKDYVHTLTSDNGHEFSQHKKISEKLGAEFYFTHPYSAWEKGLVENVNGLIRQYVPKKADFSQISPEYIRMIEDRLNNRPRKSLGWKTPMQVFLSNFVKPNQNVALVT